MPPLAQKKSDYLKRCLGRIKAAENFRQQEGLDQLWSELRDMYAGKHFPQGLNDVDRIAINLSFATINIIGPSIAVNHPKITVNANKPEDEDRAVIVEAIINYWWRTKNIKPEFSLAVQDFLIFGFGWIKTGYRYVEEERERPEEDIEQDLAAANQEADAYALDNPDMAGLVPTPEDVAANIAHTEDVVVEDAAFVDRVSPHDIYVDPMGTKMDNIRWIAQRIVKDIEEVKNNPSYKASTRKKVKATASTSDQYWRPNDRNKHKDPDAQQVIVWEYYDLRNGQMCVFTDGAEDFLVDPQAQPYEFGHPFVMLRNYEVPDQFYPMGELEAIEGLQQELNKTRSQIMNDRNQYAPKYLYDRKAFGPDAVAALQSREGHRFVPVNEGVALNEAVIPLQRQTLDPTFYQQSEQIADDIRVVSGVNEYQGGGAAQTIRRTATEASMIQDAANSRATYKLSRIEGFINEIARHLVMLAQQYMTEDQVIRVVGKQDGPPLWVDVEPDMLKGEYDFEVEAGSTQPVNEAERRASAMELFSAVGPLVGTGMIDEGEILKHVFKYGFGIKNASKFLGPALKKVPGSDLGGSPEEVAPPVEEGPPPMTPGADPTTMAADPPVTPGGPPADGAIPPELLAQLAGQMGVGPQ